MYSVRTCFSRAVGSAHISWLNHIHLFEQEKKDSDRGTIWYWWRYLAFGVNFVIPEVYTIDHFILQEKYMESSPAVAGSELEEGKDLESSTVAECSELEQDKNVESGELGERPSQDDAQTFHSQKLLPVDEEVSRQLILIVKVICLTELTCYCPSHTWFRGFFQSFQVCFCTSRMLEWGCGLSVYIFTHVARGITFVARMKVL
jgi:hypothetical protein